MSRSLLFRVLMLLGAAFCAASTAFATSAPLSERVVAYKIDANYDPRNHSLKATETLTYTNLTGQPLDRFPFHLYLNGFRPRSTWMAERRQEEMSPGKDSEGSNVIKSLVVEGVGDLTAKIHFIHPDDDNQDDQTVFEVQLPKPVPPGANVTFKIAFNAKFPEVIARTGYKRDFLLAGQWYPKVGVWWKGKWNCHQFHHNTEFFADFGTYDVSVTLPKNFVIGATGVEVSDRPNADSTKTVSFHAEDVHDFAWTASPDFKVVESRVTLSTGPVRVRLLMQPPHMASAPRYLQSLMGTMHKFDEWYGAYPYSQITVVDPPPGGMEAGGMEYPTLITADTSWWMPKALLLPEIVVEHEYGHQYWYAMVATNEFEEAWLDEGINSYSEVKAMDAMFGSKASFVNSRLGTLGERGSERLEYIGVADLDPLARNGWEYYPGAYGGITYGKTASVLLTLEAIVGEQRLQAALRTYFQRYKFKHPDGRDFTNTMNEALGQNLDWYWDQAVRGTQKLDYRVMRIDSRAAPSDKKPEKNRKPEYDYINEVVVHRKGDFIFPVTVEVHFSDGQKLREYWDGRERWHRFTWNRKATIVSAEVDPDHQIMLDADLYNNSRTENADTHAKSKLVTYWMILSQCLGQVLSWLA